MKKYFKGDKVAICNFTSTFRDLATECFFAYGMLRFTNKVATIVDVIDSIDLKNVRYVLDIDDGKYCWVSAFFQDAEYSRDLLVEFTHDFYERTATKNNKNCFWSSYDEYVAATTPKTKIKEKLSNIHYAYLGKDRDDPRVAIIKNPNGNILRVLYTQIRVYYPEYRVKDVVTIREYNKELKYPVFIPEDMKDCAGREFTINEISSYVVKNNYDYVYKFPRNRFVFGYVWPEMILFKHKSDNKFIFGDKVVMKTFVKDYKGVVGVVVGRPEYINDGMTPIINVRFGNQVIETYINNITHYNTFLPGDKVRVKDYLGIELKDVFTAGKQLTVKEITLSGEVLTMEVEDTIDSNLLEFIDKDVDNKVEKSQLIKIEEITDESVENPNSMRFSIEDNVKIKSGDTLKFINGRYLFSVDRKKYFGKRATIVDIKDNKYVIDIDGGAYLWLDMYFE